MIKHLYCHVPFCRRKCAYCAFYSVPDPTAAMVEQYLHRLEADCRTATASVADVHTVFLGGGTPTFFSAKQLRHLLTLLHRSFSPRSGAEISIECNPETLDAEKAEVLGELVNRVSLGVQSFQPEFRRRLGRHGPPGIRRAIRRLTTQGLDNLGLDLIYGIPGQTLEDWADELAEAMELPIRHLSAYALTVEEGSRLARRTDLAPVDEDLLAEMWQLTGEQLATAGFRRYEISNYAREGSACRHNLAVWQGEPYLGLGPAAASFDGQERWAQPADLDRWLAGASPLADPLSRHRRVREIFVFGLRTVQGWSVPQFQRAVGRRHWRVWHESLRPLVEAGLLEVDDAHACCTTRGLLLWDEIAQALL